MSKITYMLAAVRLLPDKLLLPNIDSLPPRPVGPSRRGGTQP